MLLLYQRIFDKISRNVYFSQELKTCEHVQTFGILRIAFTILEHLGGILWSSAFFLYFLLTC